jgi:mono/diheme cytochrome c family protein
MTKYLPNNFSVRCIRLWRMFAKVLAAAGMVALLWAPYHAAVAQQEEVVETGRQQFNDKCAVCHGLDGQGDGVLAPHLKEQPADLTRLSERNAGTFPFWGAYRKIDGRDDVGAHGPDDMPVWGTDDRYEGVGGRLAMGQILEIVFFLESIQQE